MRQWCVTLTLISLTAWGRAPAGPVDRPSDRQALVSALQSVIDRSPLRAARISIQLKSIDDDAVVFSSNADELLNPASNVKLFTAAAALDRLGADYRFETEFLIESDAKAPKNRHLMVRGKGDPTVTTERLYAISGELVHAGLKEIQDIVVDDTWFDAEREAPGYDQEVGDRPYLAPTGALSLNWNTVGIYLRPGDKSGARAVAEIEPASDYFVVSSELTTGTRSERHFTVASHADKERMHQKLEIRGTVPSDKGTWSVWKRIDEPALYFGSTLKMLLVQRGVKVKGKVRLGVASSNARTLYVAQSETLDIVLKKLNKFSSNFVAEQLIKTMGAEARGVPGTTLKGIDAVEEFLEKEVGLARGTYVMKNGSGLNDTNRFSAAQTNRLLLAMARRFPVMPEYLSALGIAGKDGTLKYRFEGSEAVGRLRAKTGTLESVSALSGYVQAVNGERFVFSILVNDFPGRSGTVVQHIDALGAAVAAMGSSEGPAAAALAMTQPEMIVRPPDDLRASFKTYVSMAKEGDRRNFAFLRTAWRSEKDPAVRALIADALYQSDPRESVAARILVESAVATEQVYGRLKPVAADLGAEMPLISSLVELASSGQVEAASRILEFVRAARDDDRSSARLAEALAVIAHDAPFELLTALRQEASSDLGMLIFALARGLVVTAQAEAPLWAALKQSQGLPDPRFVDFAVVVERSLTEKIAEARLLPGEGDRPSDPLPEGVPLGSTLQTAPGG